VGEESAPRWMGEVLEAPPGAGIAVEVTVEGQDPLSSVQVVGPGGHEFPLHDAPLAANDFTGTLVLTAAELERLPRTERGERYFYARVFQKDRDVLYSAPVWLR
jgi:hypothetical protein